MEKRRICRVIAISDLILSSLASVGILYAVLYAYFYKDEKDKIVTIFDDDDWTDDVLVYGERDAKYNAVLRATMAVLTAVIAVVCFLSIYAAWRLLKGTEQGAERIFAINSCRFWRGVAVAFLIVDIANTTVRGGASREILFSVLVIMMRLVTLFIVHSYIRELNSSLPIASTRASGSTTYRLARAEDGMDEQPPPLYSEVALGPTVKSAM